MAIHIEVATGYGGTIRIIGYVNEREIITISNQLFGKWSTGSSSCLPSKFEDAQQYVECMRLVFEEAKVHGA